MHAFGSALADLLFIKFSIKFYGEQIAKYAIFCRMISWFTLYMSTRSLTNNVEEMFTIFCLASLKMNKDSSYWSLHLFGFISFVIRATAAINLLPIYVFQFFFLCKSSLSRIKFFYQFVSVG